MGVGLSGAGAALAAEGDFSSKTINIGMVVSDLRKSLQFYQEVVGFVRADRTQFDVDADFGRRSGLTDSLAIHVEVLKLGAGETATSLKLMTFGDKAKKQENQFIHSHTGVQYMTIYVHALKPILARIKQHQVKLLGQTPIPLGEKDSFILIQDPDGTFIELIGPMQ